MDTFLVQMVDKVYKTIQFVVILTQYYQKAQKVKLFGLVFTFYLRCLLSIYNLQQDSSVEIEGDDGDHHGHMLMMVGMLVKVMMVKVMTTMRMMRTLDMISAREKRSHSSKETEPSPFSSIACFMVVMVVMVVVMVMIVIMVIVMIVVVMMIVMVVLILCLCHSLFVGQAKHVSSSL